MTILTRYILKEFLKVFGYSLAVVVSLFLVIDLAERLDDFLKHEAGFWLVFQHFFFKIPPIILQISPAAVVLATSIVVGMLVRNFEIVAIKASGISLFRTISPILTAALGISIVTFFGNELIAPYSNQKVKSTSNQIKGRERDKFFDQEQIWFRGEKGVIYNIKFFSPKEDTLQGVKLFSPEDDTLQGVTLYFLDHDNFRLIKRIDAEKAVWEEDKWAFYNVTTRVFSDFPKGIETSFKSKENFPLQETPATFKQEIREPEEMSYLELKRFIEKTTQEGYDTTKYLADLHAKLASPFINIIIVLFGIPFALRAGRHGGLALGVTISFVIGFGYWGFFQLCLVLGHGGALPPFIAAWIANFIFAVLGLYLLLHVRY